MIKSIELKDFRSFENFYLDFSSWINSIIADNWKWKTNILEAINLLCNNTSEQVGLENMIKNNKSLFFVRWIFETNDWLEQEISISYSKETRKKIISINKKSITSKKLDDMWEKSIYFSPIIMNLFYMWPSKRRDFIDCILSSSIINYRDTLKKYENVIKNRNKILKNILEWKSIKDEIVFWDNKMIELREIIYKEREKFSEYFKSQIKNFNSYFFWKVEKVEFSYISKTDLSDIKWSIKSYLEKNLDRDIILKKTQIWPHVDDFQILVDDKNLIEFASRWEIKSVIIWLKLIELDFIKEKTNKNPILLIDDFFSELDIKHIELLSSKISDYQSIISSINDNILLWNNKTYLN